MTIGQSARQQSVPGEHVFPLEQIAFANDDDLLVTSSKDAVTLWNANSGEFVRRWEARELQVLPGGRLLAEIPNSDPRVLRLTKLSELKQGLEPDNVVEIPIPRGGSLREIGMDRNGRLLIVRNNERWTVFRTTDGEPVTQIDASGTGTSEINAHLTAFRKLNQSIPRSLKGGEQLCLTNASPFVLQDTFFSPDGKSMVRLEWTDTGSSYADALLVQLNTGRIVHRFRTWYWADPPAFYPDADHVVIGVGMKAIEVRNRSSGELIRRIGNYDDEIRDLIVSDSRPLAIAASGRTLSIWNWQTGEQIKSVQVPVKSEPGSHTRPISGLEFAGNNFLARTSVGTIVFTPQLEQLHQLNRSQRVVVNQDGSQVVLVESGVPTVAKLYDLKSGEAVQLLQQSPRRRIRLSPNGRWALPVPAREPHGYARRASVPLWDLRTGRRIHVFQPDYHFLVYSSPSPTRRDISKTAVESSATSPVLTSNHGPVDARFRLKDTADIREQIERASADQPDLDGWLRSFLAKTDPLEGLQLMYELRDGTLRPSVWNSINQPVLAFYDQGSLQHRFALDGMHPTACTLSADEQQLIVAFASGRGVSSRHSIGVFEVETGKLLRRLDGKPSEITSAWKVDSLALSPNDQFLAVAYEYHDYFVDLKSADPQFRYVGKGYEGLPARKSVVFSPDSQRAVVLGYERILWDLERDENLATLGSYNGPRNFTFSPNGETLFFFGRSGPRLLNATNGNVLAKLAYEGAHVQFGRDGTRLLLQNYSSPGLWDLTTGENLALFQSEKYAPTPRTHISPNGNRVVSLHGKPDSPTTLKIWDAVTGDLVQTAQTKGAMRPADPRSPEHASRFVGEDRFLSVLQHEVILWSLDAARPIHRFEAEGESDCLAAQAGEQLLVVVPGNEARLWSLETGQVLKSFSNVPERLTWPEPVRFSANGEFLFINSDLGQRVDVWSTQTGKKLRRHRLIDSRGVLQARLP